MKTDTTIYLAQNARERFAFLGYTVRRAYVAGRFVGWAPCRFADTKHVAARGLSPTRAEACARAGYLAATEGK